MKILIIDDEYSFCKSLKEFLVSTGHKVMIATNGEQGLDILREEHPDILILDIRMPGMTGFEVFDLINQEGIRTKIIVISAVDAVMLEKSILRSGVEAILHKPVNLTKLKEIIEELSY